MRCDVDGLIGKMQVKDICYTAGEEKRKRKQRRHGQEQPGWFPKQESMLYFTKERHIPCKQYRASLEIYICCVCRNRLLPCDI